MGIDAAEEARAKAWREQQIRRARAEAARARALAGNPERARAVVAAWMPLIDRQEN